MKVSTMLYEKEDRADFLDISKTLGRVRNTGFLHVMEFPEKFLD